MTQEKYTNVQTKLVFDCKNRHQPLFSKVSKGNVERQRGTGVVFFVGGGEKKIPRPRFLGAKTLSRFRRVPISSSLGLSSCLSGGVRFFFASPLSLSRSPNKKKVLQVAPNLVEVDKCRTKRTKWNEIGLLGKKVSPFRSHRLFNFAVSLHCLSLHSYQTFPLFNCLHCFRDIRRLVLFQFLFLLSTGRNPWVPFLSKQWQLSSLQLYTLPNRKKNPLSNKKKQPKKLTI